MKKKLVGLIVLLLVSATIAYALTPKTGSFEWFDHQYFKGITNTGNFTNTGTFTTTGAVTITGGVATSGSGRFAAGVSPGNDATNLIFVDTVEITNAQIKGLRAAPKVLVAAPAAGYYIELVSATLILDYGSEVLTETVDNLVIQYTGGQDITGAIESTGFIDDAADSFTTVYPVALVGVATLAATGVELFNTGDGEIAGNATLDTTMTVKVAYRICATGL